MNRPPPSPAPPAHIPPQARLRSGIISALLFALLGPPMVMALLLLMILCSVAGPVADPTGGPGLILPPARPGLAAAATLLTHSPTGLASSTAAAGRLAQAEGLLVLLVVFQVLIYSMAALPAAITGLVHGLLWPAGGPAIACVFSSALIAAPISALNTLLFLQPSAPVWALTGQAALLGAGAAMLVALLITLLRAVSRHGQRVADRR